MMITFKGTPVTLENKPISVGDAAPDFHLIDNELNEITLKDTSGKRIFVAVPSVDTPVCDREVRKFNEEAAKISDVNIYVVSMDLPFAQARWCGGAGIDKVTVLSDYKNRDFGKNYGVYIKELGLLTRAIIIVDENNKVVKDQNGNAKIKKITYDQTTQKELNTSKTTAKMTERDDEER